MNLTIGDREFRAFQKLIETEAGVFLAEEKRPLLVGRLSKRLRQHAMSFEDYLGLIERDRAERVQMIDAILTNETSFFRDPQQFAFLEQHLVPRWKEERRERIRVWSAACSTGEEPYSLAMTLLRHFPPAQIDILATDLSTRALAAARNAIWPMKRAEPIPNELLRTFMLKGKNAHEGHFAAGDTLRSVVRFHQLRLDGQLATVREEFDVIFCRNVLIYFRTETKEQVLRALTSRLAPGGTLFLGQAESWPTPAEGLRMVRPSIYARNS